MSKNERLPAEELAGTRTIYLPLSRSGKKPEVALVVSRADEPGEFKVGFSVCSLNDPFVKALGQRIAFRRMEGCPLVGTPHTLRSQLAAHFESLNANHPGTVSHTSIFDLVSVFEELVDRFEKMEQYQSSALTTQV